MADIEKTVKISSKGQITLPKQIREVLKTDLVRIVADEGEVKIEPVKNVAGNLSRYASRYVSLEESREKAWEEGLREKHVRD
ncbi:MAG: AbrB/MazE/SpoVT family DNA-binding domain-containing protein [Planctomycetota bacterium]|jgi:AbrB family looped-hinge helix DNA binding protein